ncbi:MAG: hypothetical protein WCJ72_12540, partial [Chryseobacterium sp.]
MKQILKNNFLLKIFTVFVLILMSGCKNSAVSDLKNGDLLFVTAKGTGLSGAINNVTQKQKTASFY